MFPISDAEHKVSRFPFINIAIILANLYVFVLQLTTADPEGFISRYALTPSLVNFGDPITLIPFITSMFLHGGFLHIASNMLFLWVFGDNVEAEYPPFVYLFLYLGSGLVGAFLQYILDPTSPVPMLGASGAVAGALGAYFALFAHHRIKTIIFLPPFVSTTNVSAGLMLGYWIVLQIISGVSSIGEIGAVTGGVAFFAHIGGFISGYLFAKIFRPGRVGKED